MTLPHEPAARASGRIPLIGRDHELERLRAAFADSAAGEMRVLLFVGEAGAGKSRLVREAFALAREQGARVASGAASDSKSGRPFGLIIEVLRAARRNASTPEERGSFDEAIGLIGDAIDPEQAASRWRQVDSIVDSIVAGTVSDTPLRVMAFEDLHWADASPWRC